MTNFFSADADGIRGLGNCYFANAPQKKALLALASEIIVPGSAKAQVTGSIDLLLSVDTAS